MLSKIFILIALAAVVAAVSSFKLVHNIFLMFIFRTAAMSSLHEQPTMLCPTNAVVSKPSSATFRWDPLSASPPNAVKCKPSSDLSSETLPSPSTLPPAVALMWALSVVTSTVTTTPSVATFSQETITAPWSETTLMGLLEIPMVLPSFLEMLLLETHTAVILSVNCWQLDNNIKILPMKNVNLKI